MDKYSKAGVNIDAANHTTSLIKKHVRQSLQHPGVLAGPGLFGGMFELKGYQNPVLVSSADGVGTKLRIAHNLDIHNTIGADLVNHCINDIFTCGADPLFFLDYFATGKLDPQVCSEVVKGMAEACVQNNTALIGGETAEMPGIYKNGDYDVAGFIVGCVAKNEIIDGQKIKEGDVILALPSNGLHTNGYSLARKIMGDSVKALNTYHAGLGSTLGQEFLKIHRCYYKDLKPFTKLINGMAHITGGGLIENTPRILPDNIAAEFDITSWEIPPIFKMMQKKGKVDWQEMYRVFNMGIGIVVFVSKEDSIDMLSKLPDAFVIGRAVARRDNNNQVILKGIKK